MTEYSLVGRQLEMLRCACKVDANYIIVEWGVSCPYIRHFLDHVETLERQVEELQHHTEAAMKLPPGAGINFTRKEA